MTIQINPNPPHCFKLIQKLMFKSAKRVIAVYIQYQDYYHQTEHNLQQFFLKNI